MISLITSIKLYFAIYGCNSAHSVKCNTQIILTEILGRGGRMHNLGSQILRITDILQQKSLFLHRSHSSGALRDLLNTLQGLFSLDWLLFLNGRISVGLSKHNKWPSYPCKWRCQNWGQFFTTHLLWKREVTLQ